MAFERHSKLMYLTCSLPILDVCEVCFEHFIFVTAAHKTSIAAHFSPAPDLHAHLTACGKTDLADLLGAGLPPSAQVTQVIQDQPRGLGHAIWCAREAVDGEPFAEC